MKIACYFLSLCALCSPFQGGRQASLRPCPWGRGWPLWPRVRSLPVDPAPRSCLGGSKEPGVLGQVCPLPRTASWRGTEQVNLPRSLCSSAVPMPSPATQPTLRGTRSPLPRAVWDKGERAARGRVGKSRGWTCVPHPRTLTLILPELRLFLEQACSDFKEEVKQHIWRYPLTPLGSAWIVEERR